METGTVVLANSGATLGVPKVLNISGCINDGVAAFLDLDHNVTPLFLYYMLLSWVSVLRNINQGMGQPNLNTDIIGNLLFPLPKIEEQNMIVTKISEIDKTNQLNKKYKSILIDLKKGLMQKLLIGKIRVKE